MTAVERHFANLISSAKSFVEARGYDAVGVERAIKIAAASNPLMTAAGVTAELTSLGAAALQDLGDSHRRRQAELAAIRVGRTGFVEAAPHQFSAPHHSSEAADGVLDDDVAEFLQHDSTVASKVESPDEVGAFAG